MASVSLSQYDLILTHAVGRVIEDGVLLDPPWVHADKLFEGPCLQRPALVVTQSHNGVAGNGVEELKIHESVSPHFAEPHKPGFRGRTSHSPALGLGNAVLPNFDGVVAGKAGDCDACALVLRGGSLGG